MVEQQTIVL